MNAPLICHYLVAPPGGGKSTLADRWVARSPQYVWVSTDRIREELYGDAAVQGDWARVEAETLKQIKAAIEQGRPVIYDATNAKRAWRLNLMQKLAAQPVQWVAWWFKDTPLAVCIARNQGRPRQVEAAVIESMYDSIKKMPPLPAEGFAAVKAVPLVASCPDFEAMEQAIGELAKTQRQRQRSYNKMCLHAYSRLLDFERLLYLIVTLLHYPGIGDLHQKQPDSLKALLPQNFDLNFDTSVDEIHAVMAYQHGAIYADKSAIARDLHWLEENGIVNGPYSAKPLALADVEKPAVLEMHHRYCDRGAFERLMVSIRFIVHHPFLYVPEFGTLETLVREMEAHGILSMLYPSEAESESAQDYYERVNKYQNNFRRDIEETLKPYGIMETKPQKKGYFLGTALLSKSDLLKVFCTLEGQARHLDDPIALAAYETFRERMQYLQLDTLAHSVRTVLSEPIVGVDHLSSDSRSLAIPSNAEGLEDAIAQGKTVILRRLRGTGRHPGDEEKTFQVLPLQIVYYNIGWYLGYERLDNKLLRFERLDRLEMIQPGLSTRRTEQREALERLMKLYHASYGLYLGNDPEAQQQFLQRRQAERIASGVEFTLELWFNDAMFRFVSEGTQRFGGRVKMSERLLPATMSEAEKRSIFTLKRTTSNDFPNRFQAQVPCWVLKGDVEFRRWLLGFAGQVKVIAPDFLVEDIRNCGKQIYRACSDK